MVTIVLVLLCAALIFSAVLALVDRLQKGKKKNFPPLDSSGDEPYTDKTGFDVD